MLQLVYQWDNARRGGRVTATAGFQRQIQTEGRFVPGATKRKCTRRFLVICKVSTCVAGSNACLCAQRSHQLQCVAIMRQQRVIYNILLFHHA